MYAGNIRQGNQWHARNVSLSIFSGVMRTGWFLRSVFYPIYWESVSDDTLLLRGRGCYDHMRDRDCLGIYWVCSILNTSNINGLDVMLGLWSRSARDLDQLSSFFICRRLIFKRWLKQRLDRICSHIDLFQAFWDTPTRTDLTEA